MNRIASDVSTVYGLLMPWCVSTASGGMPRQRDWTKMGTDEPFAPVILVVEDDPPVRMVAAELLRDNGFSVLEAGDADQAIRILQSSTADVSVMVSDVMMPGSMDGIQLADWASHHRPAMGILLVSGWRGWTGDACRHEILAKPYSFDHLLAKVRERFPPPSRRSAPLLEAALLG
jgi:CheY-like chemotaxis protein